MIPKKSSMRDLHIYYMIMIYKSVIDAKYSGNDPKESLYKKLNDVESEIKIFKKEYK